MGSGCANLKRDLVVIVKDPSSRLLLLRHNGAVVGMMHYRLGTSLSKGKNLTIEDVIVDSAHKRKGFGSMMIAIHLRIIKRTKLLNYGILLIRRGNHGCENAAVTSKNI
jgi:ribosomal protein S18 acetylase RimI-like enzyme